MGQRYEANRPRSAGPSQLAAASPSPSLSSGAKRRPQSAINYGQIRTVSTPQPIRIQMARLGNKFKSTALEMEVRLVEDLRHLSWLSFPYGATDHEILQVYASAFDRVIQCDKGFSSILGIIKNGYHSILNTEKPYEGRIRHIVKSPKPNVYIPPLAMDQVESGYYSEDYDDEEGAYGDEEDVGCHSNVLPMGGTECDTEQEEEDYDSYDVSRTDDNSGS